MNNFIEVLTDKDERMFVNLDHISLIFETSSGFGIEFINQSRQFFIKSPTLEDFLMKIAFSKAVPR